MIKNKLNIVLVEDNKDDVFLIKRQINKIVSEPNIEVTDNLQDFRELLVNFAPDVVLSDYNLPKCTGLDIMETAKEYDSSIELIFITGTINDEELAANTILNGASGYILKKHMNILSEKLNPLLKKVVINMVSRDELRDRIRNNKITVNQIYNYLDKINSDNAEQRDNIQHIKQAITQFNLDNGDIK
ncbi:response regulator [Gramella sp. MAR_2010_147]|uniref:response regulator n=1 Tax=Gramella sp. MAR_2010_147 TaxID=1250205 RepID=UPI00087CE50D|nr:response regulator [Gramella sp. MAR_2010_147]SDR70744.1 Response regulator receiver domain-containing protein [Gramella sp. MAR_2010_147]